MPGSHAPADVRWLWVSACALSAAAGPGDDDDDDDDAGPGGGGSGGNIDPDDDEGYDEEDDDDEDEEPLQVSAIRLCSWRPASAGRSRGSVAPVSGRLGYEARKPALRSHSYVLHRTKCAMIRLMWRPASFDGCPPHALPDPGNRIIGF